MFLSLSPFLISLSWPLFFLFFTRSGECFGGELAFLFSISDRRKEKVRCDVRLFFCFVFVLPDEGAVEGREQQNMCMRRVVDDDVERVFYLVLVGIEPLRLYKNSQDLGRWVKGEYFDVW